MGFYMYKGFAYSPFEEMEKGACSATKQTVLIYRPVLKPLRSVWAVGFRTGLMYSVFGLLRNKPDNGL